MKPIFDNTVAVPTTLDHMERVEFHAYERGNKLLKCLERFADAIAPVTANHDWLDNDSWCALDDVAYEDYETNREALKVAVAKAVRS